MVITWLPKREMTSTSLDRQKGQRTPCADVSRPPCGGDSGLDISLPPCGGGSGWGVTLPTGGHVSLLGKALQHNEGRPVDTLPHIAAPSALPPGAIDGPVGETLTHSRLPHQAHVGNPVRRVY